MDKSKCRVCGKPFVRKTNNQKYCPDGDCKKIVKKAGSFQKWWDKKKAAENATIDKLPPISIIEGPPNPDKSLYESLSKLDLTFRDSVKPLTPPLQAWFDYCIVLSDIHIPFHSRQWTGKAFKEGYRIKKRYPDKKVILAIAGDLLDLVMFGSYGHNDADASAKQSIKEGGLFLEAALGIFDEIYICPGNHDIRFVKALKGKLGFGSLMRLMMAEMGSQGLSERIHVTSRNYILLNEDWAACHPMGYSRIATTVPRKLAARHRRNVICGHTHHAPSHAPTECGQYIGVENGCLQDKSKVGYLRNMTNFPEHQFGYTILGKCADGKTRFKQRSEQDYFA
jgi:UDP-2,3-diacylglucosamine pyrophosphatase LpxH